MTIFISLAVFASLIIPMVVLLEQPVPQIINIVLMLVCIGFSASSAIKDEKKVQKEGKE